MDWLHFREMQVYFLFMQASAMKGEVLLESLVAPGSTVMLSLFFFLLACSGLSLGMHSHLGLSQRAH